MGVVLACFSKNSSNFRLILPYLRRTFARFVQSRFEFGLSVAPRDAKSKVTVQYVAKKQKRALSPPLKPPNKPPVKRTVLGVVQNATKPVAQRKNAAAPHLLVVVKRRANQRQPPIPSDLKRMRRSIFPKFPKRLKRAVVLYRNPVLPPVQQIPQPLRHAAKFPLLPH